MWCRLRRVFQKKSHGKLKSQTWFFSKTTALPLQLQNLCGFLRPSGKAESIYFLITLLGFLCCLDNLRLSLQSCFEQDIDIVYPVNHRCSSSTIFFSVQTVDAAFDRLVCFTKLRSTDLFCPTNHKSMTKLFFDIAQEPHG